MSYVIAAPEMMTAAAADVATIGSTLDAANVAAALPTVAMTSAAADEVSVGIAQLFSQHAQDYQAVAAQAAAYQDHFAQKLTASAAAYASTEDAIASLLHASVGSFPTTLDAGIGLVFGPDAQQFFERLPTILGTLFIYSIVVAVIAYVILYAIIGNLFYEYTGNPWFFTRPV